MATYFWVGGTGNWSDATNHWAASSNGAPGAGNLPTSTDNVVFDASSNGAGTGAFTVTVSAVGATCQNFTASGLDGVMTFSAGNFTLTITGTFSIPTTNFAVTSSAGAFNFTSSGSVTVTTNGITINCDVQFNGTGTFQLVDNFTMASNRTCYHFAGTLDLNNKVLSCGIWNSSTITTRVLVFGTSGQITIQSFQGTVCSVNNTTGLSYTGTPVFNLTYTGSSGTRIINYGTSGGSSTIAASFNISAGSDIISFGAGSYFNSLNFTGFSGTLAATSFNIYGNVTIPVAGSPGTGMTLTAGTQTWTFPSTSGTDTITTNGQTLDFNLTFNGAGGTWQFLDALTQGSTKTFTFSNGTVQFKNGTTNTVGSFVTSGSTLKYLTSTTAGSRATISQASGTVTATYLSIKDSAATGGATFDATAATNVDAGNNTGWSFSLLTAISISIGGGITIGGGINILN